VIMGAPSAWVLAGRYPSGISWLAQHAGPASGR
jgi:hypothetical protein